MREYDLSSRLPEELLGCLHSEQSCVREKPALFLSDAVILTAECAPVNQTIYDFIYENDARTLKFGVISGQSNLDSSFFKFEDTWIGVPHLKLARSVPNKAFATVKIVFTRPETVHVYHLQ